RELDRHLPLNVCVIWLADESCVSTPGGTHLAEEKNLARPARQPSTLSLTAVSPTERGRAAALGLTPGLLVDLEKTPFATCWTAGQALYADWTPARPSLEVPATAPADWLSQHLVAHGATASFATPLRAGDRTVGVLQAVCCRPAGFSNEQIQVLYLVADLLGPAILNCQLFGRLRATCDELQSTQAQLIHTEKMRALGELASGMAHDFNNALCGVLGFLELTLTDATLSAASRGHLELARTCALDAAQTVRRVQDFSRKRGSNAASAVFDLNDLARQTLELTRHKWEGLMQVTGAPIVVRLRLGGRPGWPHGAGEAPPDAAAAGPVGGSAVELREVLTNLIFNAVDAMPQGGTLTVSSWRSPTDVYLEVADPGMGMPPEVRQRLFEPF